MRIALAASCFAAALTITTAATTIVHAQQQAAPAAAPMNLPENAAVPAEGTKAPAFALPSQSGATESLSSFKGKWVVLYFYPEDFTAGCTLEAHNFERDAAKYQQLNATIVGVSVDSVDSHKQFCAKEGLNFHLLSDVDKKMVAQYGSLNPKSGMASRNTFLISPYGKIEKVWIKVSPAQHSAEVLSAIEAAKHA